MTCPGCHLQTGETDSFCPACGTPLRVTGSTREARKVVAILFMDLVGSTSLAEGLDPEPLRQIMDRYFASSSQCIAEHGGAIEKFIGDAILAVFGATISHEDDALRAVRAAAGALDRLSELSTGLSSTHKVSLEARCGICSGEVMAITTPDGGFRVIGDPVNTASRLQTAAQPGEILVDELTASMVRSLVGLEPVQALHLKGKAQPVPAWRVTDLQPHLEDAHAGPAAPLIGRDDELDDLRHIFRRVRRRQQICLVTMLGAPGIGKSRLAREFVGGLAPDDALVLTGRCSSYGRGITYKPLTEMLASYPGGWAAIARRLGSAQEADGRALRCLSSIMLDSPPERGEQVGTEEISWAIRYLLTKLGRSHCVVMVWEDLQWAEATLLDLIDDVATWLTDAPVLMLCVSRNELIEQRPTWGGGKLGATTLELGPLSYGHSAELVSELALHDEVLAHQQGALCERVARECEGNPFFAELMLDVFAAAAPSSKIPPTISALLTARLDQLSDQERQLLEIASAIGRDFRWNVLQAMVNADGIGDRQADVLITQLVRRRIVERVSPGNFRFGQVLLRDTAYALSPKARREHWHLFLAGWFSRSLPQAGTGSSAVDQLAIAFHVEAASLLRRELRPGDSGLPELAFTAAQILIAEGTKALRRKDLPGAAALLERGRNLLPDDDPGQTPLALYICDAWLGLSDPDRALAALDSGARPLAGSPGHQIVCRIQRCIVALRLGLALPQEVAADAGALAGELAGFPADDRAWCRQFQLQAYLQLAEGHIGKAEAQLRLALDCARSVQDDYEEGRILGAICELSQWTPHPVSVGLSLCAELSVQFAANRALLVPVLLTRARLSALAGDLPGARDALAAVRAYASDLHLDLADAATMAVSGLVASLSDLHQAAEADYRGSQALLLTLGQAGAARTYEACAARELFEQGAVERASQALEQLTAESAAGQAGDLRTQIIIQALEARILSARGEHDRAVRLATQTALAGEDTDDLCLQGDALFDLSVVLHEAARADPERADTGLADTGLADTGLADTGLAEAGLADTARAGAASAAALRALERYQARGATRLAARVERWLAGSGQLGLSLGAGDRGPGSAGPDSGAGDRGPGHEEGVR